MRIWSFVILTTISQNIWIFLGQSKHKNLLLGKNPAIFHFMHVVVIRS
jgi:hypothetical protein